MKVGRARCSAFFIYLNMPTEIEIMLSQLSSVDLPNAIPEIIEETQGEIVQRVQGQLRKGELPTGAKISPSYKSGYYARKKFEQNSEPGYGVPDAYRTGTYYKGMGVIADREEYLTDSNVIRNRLAQYGENLLSMSDENKSQYAQGTLLEKIKERYREQGIIFS